MIDKSNNELKLIRDKVNEIEEEMSVSTKNNIYFEDIRKSRKLLVYRYALLLQIKDIARVRAKISHRVEKIQHLKSQAARGRILTQREQEAIYNLRDDLRKREDIIEQYDNKIDLYADKRLAYYGIDETLIDVFMIHAEEFYPFFEVSEKNVIGLKNSLDEIHNFKKEDMNKEEIVALNTDRYGDEIIEFELGIKFSDENENQIVEFTIETPKSKLSTQGKSKLELLESKLEEILNDKSKIDLEEKLEKENFIVTETGETIDTNLTVEDDILNGDNISNYENEIQDELSENADKSIKQSDEVNNQKTLNNKQVVKTVKSIKDKLILKGKLENYLGIKTTSDVARDDYNNMLINSNLSNDDEIYNVELLLTNDIYQLGILVMMKDEVINLNNKANLRRNRKDKAFYQERIDELSNEMEQLKMQYNYFPGHSFVDVKDYSPENVVDALKRFTKGNEGLDLTNIYIAVIDFTFTAEDVRKKYEAFYCANKGNKENFEKLDVNYYNQINDESNN